ncbi:MAG: ComF family protein [Dehalococcoidia bacterium]
MGGRASSIWRVLRGEIAELLLPQRCIDCGTFGAALHAACIEELPRADGARCARCWTPLRGTSPLTDGVRESDHGEPLCARCALAGWDAIEGRRAAFRYEGVARTAILEAKFRGLRSVLTPLAEAAASAIGASWEIEAVVPVPLHPSRRRRRGYDQGAVIARAVGGRLGLPVREDLIRRERRTRAQSSLGREERARNVEGAFGPRRPSGEAPARVLLVDDVLTTGATLEAAAVALRLAGVEHVFALALAIEDEAAPAAHGLRAPRHTVATNIRDSRSDTPVGTS